MKRIMVLSIIVCALCAPAVWSAKNQPNNQASNQQVKFGFSSVGFGVGIVDPEDVDVTAGFSFFGDFAEIRPNVNLEMFLGYWQQSEDVWDGGDVTLRDFTIMPRCKYMFDLQSPTVTPFAGAGLGFHIVSAGIDVPTMEYGGGVIIPGYSEDETELKLGLDLGGGLLFNVKDSMAIQTDAWYSMVSDVSHLALRVGLVFKLGR